MLLHIITKTSPIVLNLLLTTPSITLDKGLLTQEHLKIVSSAGPLCVQENMQNQSLQKKLQIVWQCIRIIAVTYVRRLP